MFITMRIFLYKTFDNDINSMQYTYNYVCVSICMPMRLTIYTIAR